MNFQCDPVTQALRVMMVNPLVPASQLFVTKVMSGRIFGNKQLIDLTLLVYANETDAAQEFKQEVMSCAFSCYNSITITSNLPTISDADVFCFMTNLENPNYLNFTSESPAQFDSLYLILKVASNICKQEPADVKVDPKEKRSLNNSYKPIIIGDSLVVIDILNTFSKVLPSDILFYCTSLPSIAKGVLSEHLKVQSNEIDDVLAWAANEETFYLRLEDRRILTMDEKTEFEKCEWDSKAIHTKYSLDYTQFSPEWLKKDFLDKVKQLAMKNPYGCIYKAAEFAKTLREIWKARTDEPGIKLKKNIGVISDGSLGTIQGLPYVLPLIFSGESWTVNKIFEEESHLKSEIKRMNKVMKEHHDKLVVHCKKFYEENIVNLSFIPVDDGSGSTCTLLEQSTRSTASKKTQSEAGNTNISSEKSGLFPTYMKECFDRLKVPGKTTN